MSEVIDLNALDGQQGLQKDNDGFYTVPVRLPLSDDGSAVADLFLRFATDPTEFLSDKNVNLSMSPVKDAKLVIPTTGMIAQMTVASVVTDPDMVGIILIADDYQAAQMVGSNFPQVLSMRMPFSKETVAHHVPGRTFLVSVEFAAKESMVVDGDTGSESVDNLQDPPVVDPSVEQEEIN